MRLVSLLITLLFAGSAWAASVQRLPLGELAKRSELVFVGTVTAQQSRLVRAPHTQVFTDTEFRVEQVLKGTKTESWTLSQLGGVVGEGAEQVGQAVPGYPSFEVGERVVLFLERTQTGRLVPTGLNQGKYTISPDPKGGTPWAVRSSEGLHYVGPAPVLLAGVPNPNRLRLTQLFDVIRGLTPRGTPLRLKKPSTRQVDLATEAAR